MDFFFENLLSKLNFIIKYYFYISCQTFYLHKLMFQLIVKFCNPTISSRGECVGTYMELDLIFEPSLEVLEFATMKIFKNWKN
jgi:hypothetical protein